MVENVLLSGGSGGIGRALCRQLTETGYRPIIGYNRNKGEAQTIASETGGIALHLDLTDHTCIEDAVNRLVEEPAPFAGVILAASPPPAIGPVFRLPENEMTEQWSVNVEGAHCLLGATIKKILRPQKTGWVVGILSDAMGLNTFAAKSMGGYIIAKYGLMGLLKVVDAEFSWLDVHTVSPGYTETPMLEVFDPRFLDQIRETQPGQRFATAEEVADSVMSKIKGI